MLRDCVNFKTIRYESTSLKRIVADKSHRVIVALGVSVLAIVILTLKTIFLFLQRTEMMRDRESMQNTCENVDSFFADPVLL